MENCKSYKKTPLQLDFAFIGKIYFLKLEELTSIILL